MKKYAIGLLAIMLVLLIGAVGAHAALITFHDQDFLDGKSWGTMEITVEDIDTLRISYSAETWIPVGSKLTGFGFDFDTAAIGISNPADNTFDFDQNDLNWLKGSIRYGSIPQPYNGDDFSPAITKYDYTLFVTEGNANNFTPPGIEGGETDVFYVDFDQAIFASFADPEIYDFVNFTGIRLQSLPDEINEGSLYLAGDPSPVPIPGSLMLLGSGLIGLFGVRRRTAKE